MNNRDEEEVLKRLFNIELVLEKIERGLQADRDEREQIRRDEAAQLVKEARDRARDWATRHPEEQPWQHQQT